MDFSIYDQRYPSRIDSRGTTLRKLLDIADSRYESIAENPENSFGILQHHAAIQQRCL
jgi:hypothetical protein